MSRQSKPFPIFISILISLVVLAVGAVVGFFLWWESNLQSVDAANQIPQIVVIPPASGANQIASMLKEQKLIKNELVFKLYIKKTNADRNLKPGRYEFSQSQNLASIVQQLTEGVAEDFWVTIPEGKRREELAYILAKAYKEKSLPFSIPDFLTASENLEGYLFPDTYLIPKDMTAEAVVELLRTTFDAKIPDEIKLQANALELSFQEVLTLASLVEREAKFEKDRPKVARVLLNRLDIDMPLQIDATVQYAVGEAQCQNKLGQDCDWWPVISSTTFDSPYNTYKYPGLPPSPIANPGMASIQAVLKPVDHNYLFYLSEASGTTHYAETLEEHNQNIDKYLR